MKLLRDRDFEESIITDKDRGLISLDVVPVRVAFFRFGSSVFSSWFIILVVANTSCKSLKMYYYQIVCFVLLY